MTDDAITYLTVRQYAELTGRSYNHTHLLVTSRKLASFRVGQKSGQLLIRSDAVPAERGRFVNPDDCEKVIPPPPPEMLVASGPRKNEPEAAFYSDELVAVMGQLGGTSRPANSPTGTIVHRVGDLESGRPRKTDRVSGITYLTRILLKSADTPTILAFARTIAFFDKNRTAQVDVFQLREISGLQSVDCLAFLGQLEEVGWVRHSGDGKFAIGVRFGVNVPYEEFN